MIEFRFLNLEYLFNLIYEFLTQSSFSFSFIDAVIFWIKLFSLFLTPVLFVVVFILSIKLGRLRAQETADMKAVLASHQYQAPMKNERWEKVLVYLSSDNPAEWKLAVIESDNMLDDLVKQLRTVGDNLGERLKSIEPSDFLTLDDAWEAHKVRNRIAHESGFVLTKVAARRTIERYKRVFEEFEYI